MVAEEERIRPERFVVQSAAEIKVVRIGPAPDGKDDKAQVRPLPDDP